jgi:hypothetical protein
MSDAKRYFITVIFAGEYQRYLSGGKGLKVYAGKNESKTAGNPSFFSYIAIVKGCVAMP